MTGEELSHDAARARARAMATGGNAAAARDAYLALLRERPGDPEALNYLAMLALARGHLADARDRLRQSLDANPGDPTTLKNLGVVLLHAGEPAEAEAILDDLVRRDPSFFVARLHLGLARERLGNVRAAITDYVRAIVTAQSQGQWTSPRTTPAGLRPTVEHAMRVARDGRRRLLAETMAPLHARFGREAMARVDRCVAAYLGDLRLPPPDSRQRPQFLYFPDLPSEPVLAPSLFPWYPALEQQTEAIQSELAQVLQDRPQLEPFLGEPPPGLESSYLGRSDGSHDDAPRWDAFFFFRHGKRFDANADRCPGTVRALESTPIVRIRDHAPEALFSVLGPGSHIRPHHGVTNTRVVTHLPLIVPDGCRLRVADHVHAWEPGRCFTFDDTFEHEAWNRSNRTRVILLFDVWNPHLSEAEQAALSELVARLGELDAQER